MADTKISAATAVVTPAPTDQYATNQGGVSKRTTRAQVHALESGEHLIIPLVNEPLTPTLAIGDVDNGFFSDNAARIKISMGGVTRFQWTGNAYQGDGGNGAAMINNAASATLPTLLPSAGYSNSGIGLSAADNVSVVAGGLEAVRVEDPADLAASETSLWLYDDDNGAIQQVTVGAADSGGAGFKVLRILN